MANAFRAPLHRTRKRILTRLERRIWPSIPLEDVSTWLVRTERYRDQLAELADLPAFAKDILGDWRREVDLEGILKFDRPCTVDPKMGIVFVGGRVVWGSSDAMLRERGPRFLSHLGRAQERLPAAILLHHIYGDNYFHFLSIVVAKAAVAEREGLAKDIPFLVPEKTAATRFFRDAAALGLFGARRIIVQPKRKVFAVDEAYAIRGFDCHLPYFEWACERMRVPERAPDRPGVFIARGKNAPNARVFRNQADIDRAVKEHGLESFDPMEHPLKDQIARFAAAPMIVAGHGAGLTNMMFRRTNPCHVVEIFSPNFGTPHYYMMASQRGFDYSPVLAANPIGKACVASTEANLQTLQHVLGAFPTRHRRA